MADTPDSNARSAEAHPPAGRGLLHALRRLVDGLPGAMLGALVYALWAVYANRTAGMQVAIPIGVVHWLTSTALTYYGTAIMRAFFARGHSVRQGALLAFFGGMGCTYSVLVLVHVAIGTPHIAMTLAAGVIPTLLFCFGYALLLARTTQSTTAMAQA